jgi:hypothetical protein
VFFASRERLVVPIDRAMRRATGPWASARQTTDGGIAMLDLLYLFLATVPIATGFAFVLVAWRDRRRAQAIPVRAIEPERR